MLVGSCVGFTVAAAAVTMEVIAGASRGCWVKSIFVSNSTAAVSQGIIQRSSTKGIIPTLIAPVEFNPGLAGQTLAARFAVAWGTPPAVVGSGVFWGFSLAAAIGENAFEDFTLKELNNKGRGIWVPAGTSLCYQSLVATGAPLVTMIIAEE